MWPFHENPICPDPVWKPVNYVSQGAARLAFRGASPPSALTKQSALNFIPNIIWRFWFIFVFFEAQHLF